MDPRNEYRRWGARQPAEGQDPSQIETVAQTQLGTVMGTIAYMSPEQARGRAVDQTSDVFSLGVVIYEMVTGELPFKGDSPVDTMHAIAFEEVRPVTVVRKNLPPDLHRIVSRCLRKRPEDRYPDARALADDLQKLKRDIDSGFRNRSTRMQKRFVSKIRKLPGVKAILVRGGQFTVIVDKAEAKVYLRVNSLVEQINAKLFHGEPFEAAVRDDLSEPQLMEVLREPGVVYVREDILGK